MADFQIERHNIMKSYKFYVNNTENIIDKGYAENRKIYVKIINGYIEYIVDKIINGFQVQLSGGNSLGTLAIVLKKVQIKLDSKGNMKTGCIDWKTTKQFHKDYPDARARGEVIRFTNEHTNGYKINIVWWKTGMNIGNKWLYSFTACRAFRKLASKKVVEGQEYITSQKN